MGKSTISSAIVIQFSYDRKVLLLSTDPAHSLGDGFRLEFSGTPRMIPGVPNLSVMEVDPVTTLASEISVHCCIEWIFVQLLSVLSRWWAKLGALMSWFRTCGNFQNGSPVPRGVAALPSFCLVISSFVHNLHSQQTAAR